MTFKIARVGDSCTHGAVVITGDASRIVDDRKVARVGDMVSCPIPKHGINPIVSSTANIVVTGDKKTAHIVSVSACGAMIITGSESVIIDRTPDQDS